MNEERKNGLDGDERGAKPDEPAFMEDDLAAFGRFLEEAMAAGKNWEAVVKPTTFRLNRDANTQFVMHIDSMYKQLGLTSKTTPVRQRRPPGDRIMFNLAEVLFSKKQLRRIYRPLIADYRHEYCEAAKSGRLRLAFVVLRHWWGFLKTCGFTTALGWLAQLILKING